jgi:hypothetical protein
LAKAGYFFLKKVLSKAAKSSVSGNYLGACQFLVEPDVEGDRALDTFFATGSFGGTTT